MQILVLPLANLHFRKVEEPLPSDLKLVLARLRRAKGRRKSQRSVFCWNLEGFRGGIMWDSTRMYKSFLRQCGVETEIDAAEKAKTAVQEMQKLQKPKAIQFWSL